MPFHQSTNNEISKITEVISVSVVLKRCVDLHFNFQIACRFVQKSNLLLGIQPFPHQSCAEKKSDRTSDKKVNDQIHFGFNSIVIERTDIKLDNNGGFVVHRRELALHNFLVVMRI
jgi:hypothetical protein